METEQRSGPSPRKRRGATPRQATPRPTPTRSSRKALPIAVLIAVLSLAGLLAWRVLVDGPPSAIPDGPASALERNGGQAPGAAPTLDPQPQPLTTFTETVTGAVRDLSEGIERWFAALREEHAGTRHELSAMAESMRAIHASLSELRQDNRDIDQRLARAQSRLDHIVKQLRGLALAAKKKDAETQQRRVSEPPFQIDAIDLWDDAVYVAVSRNGRAAFLREGERRAGWRVTRIDRLAGRVVFQGPQGQDYSVSIRG